MTESTLPPLLDDTAADPGVDALRAAVQEVVRGVAKAFRTWLLYEGHGPALEQFLDTLRGQMAALWEEATQLTVMVEERDLLWDGAAVYRGEERDNLAFLLFKDGVRELSFYPGFERDDLDTFLALLAQVHRARPDEDDLLTLLWDHDWSALRYRYVEPLGEGVEVPQAEEGEPPAIESAAAELALVSSVSTDDFEAALYFLDEEELRRLEAELKGEMERDLWAGVLDALFDRLEDGPPARQEHVMRVLADILPTLLGAGKVETAAYFLGELVGVAAGGKMPAPVLRAVRALFDQLGAPETVAELVRTVEQAGSAIAPGSLGRLLAFFPPDSLGPLLRAGETSGSPGVRAQVQQSAERLADAHRDHLSRLVADADPYVAAGAARLLGRLRVAAASGEVARLLERPEAGLRLVAVEALQELRASSAAGALEAALDDPDRDVRVAAARALAALRYAPARPKLEAALDGKRLREADLTERIAFFEAYGGLAGGDGVALLDRVLNGKNWLGRRESPEMRACAALGLGRIRLPAAERALAAAAADPDPVVRSAVGRALRALKA